MFSALHANKPAQLILGLVIGFLFGFLLQKGNVTEYDVIVGQLLFRNFTVIKIMVTAMLTGMIGVHLLRSLGFAQLHPKPGSLGMTLVGGLIFGVGFAVLGYCPGTIAAAVAQGKMDAFVGGMSGIIIGAGLYAHSFPYLSRTILPKGDFGTLTFPELLRVTPWVVILPLSALLIGLLVWLERAGL
ncbi:YeeE/YedE family protein [Geobacter sulfurreducens]|uniref:YeeE/YedE family protein n=1 Tax=Geobacter sulfurreducens (strain ATCC 51573 / DSM 12127 / PCA) TaxID=243231 RepID=Q74AP1_GEOSL|nr:YeeE/YedE thiosulfate transporter family protein [Geobacter sulfurreducens]AAR35687.1 YeeE/YedE family protein [Geobacter sulfurreducens PCA]ADI85069.1 YeeE/YedE family protein [Geobacter sulfurreducens KN400]UAC03020.1 YeeE/YedE family protein [Geobacter sulfurreducens]UTG91668.1 YeeE/YedE family protein [Geobacter sulfurreducens]HBB69180.1 YeeE/YedE family protein [Geobacter sulfurreducens]